MTKPFTATIGISYTKCGFSVSGESNFIIEPPIEAWETIETPCASAELIYMNDCPDAFYELLLIADIAHELNEPNTDNNSVNIRWWFDDPEEQ